MTIEIVENIRNNIAKDKLDIAIKLFRTHCIDFSDELILHSSKYTNLKSAIRKGIISREQSNIERNIICNSLLELLNEVDVQETKLKNDTHNLSNELRDILGLAELISRRKGKTKTSTKDFFTALVSLNPKPLSTILGVLNDKEALPQTIDNHLLSLPRKLSNNRPLSGCLTESLRELGTLTTPKDEITTADIFIDVSKYGKGKSVAKLRKRGVGKTEIENYVEEFGLHIKRRQIH